MSGPPLFFQSPVVQVILFDPYSNVVSVTHCCILRGPTGIYIPPSLNKIKMGSIG